MGSRDLGNFVLFWDVFSILINLQTPETTAQHDRATRGPGGAPRTSYTKEGTKHMGAAWNGRGLPWGWEGGAPGGSD